jgi:hypothetical protein
MSITSTMEWCSTKPDPGSVVSRQARNRIAPFSMSLREAQNPQLMSYGDLIAPGEYRAHSRFYHAANYLQREHLVSIVDRSIGAGPLNIVLEKYTDRKHDRVIVGNGYVILDDCKYTYASRYDSSLPDLSQSNFQIIRDSLPNFKRFLIDLAPTKSIAFLLNRKRESSSAASFDAILRNQFLKSTTLIEESRILEAVRIMKGLGFGLTPSGDDFISGFILGLHIQQASLKNDFQNLIEDIFETAQNDNLLSRAWLRCAREGRVFEKMKQAICALGQIDPDNLLRATYGLLTVGSTSGVDMAVGFIFGIEKAPA